MTIKDCPIGKILNTITNRCVKIDGKIGKDIIKNLKLKRKNINDDNKEKTILSNKFENCKKKLEHTKYIKVKDKFNNSYLIINDSIINDLDKNDVILDPAGLSFMQKNFSGAGWASQAIYKLLSEKKPNTDVIKHFKQFKDDDYLYEKNTNNLSIAYYTSYKNNIKIIHAVGPDFTLSHYLKKIIKNNDLTDLYNLFYKIYNDIYKTFINEYRNNNCLQLRLLPISTGAFIGFNKNYKIKIFKCLKNIYQSLNKKYNIKPVIYLYDKDNYKLFKNIILE
jgi:hypothetical protein